MKVIDPVCGMTIEKKDAAAKSVHEGKTYSFCSPSCKASFDANPEAYLGAKSDVPHEAPLALQRPHFIPAPCTRKYVRLAGCMSQVRHGPGTGHAGRFSENTMDLPHAPPDHSRPAGQLPYLRHGPGAQNGGAG